VEVQAYLLKQSAGGAWVQWSVPSLFETFVGSETAGVPWGRWYHKGVSVRRGRLHKLGLPADLHQRRAAVAGGNDESRIFPVPTWSTFAALLFLVRLGNDDYRAYAWANVEARRGWRAACESLLETWMHKAGPVTLGICVDLGAQVTPGVPLQGQNRVKLTVTAGTVDLAELLAAEPRRKNLSRTLAALRKVAPGGQAPVLAVLQVLDSGGAQMEWLLAQMLHGVAAQFEDLCRSSDLASTVGAVGSAVHAALDTLETDLQRHRRVRKWKHHAAMQLRVRLPEGLLDQVARYYFCLRRTFQDAQHLTFAVDASRVGGRNRMLVFFATADNPGGWAPPQARRGEGTGGGGKFRVCWKTMVTFADRKSVV